MKEESLHHKYDLIHKTCHVSDDKSNNKNNHKSLLVTSYKMNNQPRENMITTTNPLRVTHKSDIMHNKMKTTHTQIVIVV